MVPPVSQYANTPTGMSDMVMAVDAQVCFVPMTVDTDIRGIHVQPLVDTRVGVSLIHVTTLEHLQSNGVKCVVHQWQSAWIISANGDASHTGFCPSPGHAGLGHMAGGVLSGTSVPYCNPAQDRGTT